VGPLDATAAARFWSKVAYAGPSACWPWLGGRHAKGYGVFHVASVPVLAHRVAWRLARGPIPEGLVVDHLCGERLCVNVRHLALVTAGENVLRGRGPSAINARRTHCPRGHAYAWPNLYVHRGRRQCRACRLAHNRAWWRRHGAEWRRKRAASSRAALTP
jgi:hypothetical protein